MLHRQMTLNIAFARMQCMLQHGHGTKSRRYWRATKQLQSLRKRLRQAEYRFQVSLTLDSPIPKQSS